MKNPNRQSPICAIVGALFAFGLAFGSGATALANSAPDPGGGGDEIDPEASSEAYNVPGDGRTPTAMQTLNGLTRHGQAARHLAAATEKGVGSYRVPLRLPPALFAPSLSLTYSSSGGVNLEMPYAWSLDGIPEIERPVERAYAATDRLLSGAGLSGVLRPESTGASRHVLRTSGSAHVTATYDSAQDDWTVRTSDGVTWELAAADDGADSPSGTGRWRAVRGYDRTGNLIELSYNPNHTISDVYYGGNAQTGEGHLVQVHFTYATPEERSAHAHTSARKGFLETYIEVVKSIEVYSRPNGGSSWTIARGYVLHLTVDPAFTLLDRVEERGCETAGCTRVTSRTLARFGYSAYADGSPADEVIGVAPPLGTSITMTVKESAADYDLDVTASAGSGPIDVNGDGLPDSFGLTGATYQSYDPTTGEHAWNHSISFGNPASVVNPPVVIDDLDHRSYALSQILDVNGDGLPDVVNSDRSTSWEIWYGTGTDFEGPYTEPAPWTVSQIAVAPDADALLSGSAPGSTTAEEADILKSLIDFNGDGWLDCMSLIEGKVWLRNPEKGGGWASNALQLNLQTANRWVTYWIEPDPIDSWRSRIDASAETAGFYDLNADGLPDYVVASGSGSWSVHFGNGRGFASAVRWAAPLEYISMTLEGYASRMAQGSNVGQPEWFEGWDQELRQGLLDVDGDGYLDLVRSGTTPGLGHDWYRNLGDGFEGSPRALPSWWPDALSISSIVAMSYPTGHSGATTMTSTDTRAVVMDINFDGMLDAISDGDIAYGVYPRPYLLISTENLQGATTGLTYRPSSIMYPAGDPSVEQHMPALQHLVTMLQTADVVTGQGATTTFSYEFGHHLDGVFRGFEARSATQYRNGALVSLDEERFELSPELDPLVTEHIHSFNACLSFAPALSRACSAATQPRFAAENEYDDYGLHRRLRRRQVTDYGEDATTTPRDTVIEYDYDDFGNVLQAIHDGGGVPEDAITWDFAYTSDDSGEVFRLAETTVTGHDPLNGIYRAISRKRYLYDDNGDALAPLSSGLLTGVVVSAGWYDGGEDLDDATLAWTMTRGARGELESVVEQATGRTVTQTYAFGGAVLAGRTDGIGHRMAWAVDDRGRVTEERDVSNRVAKTTTYDGLDRPIQRERIDATGARLRTDTTTYTTNSVPNYARIDAYNTGGALDRVTYQVRDGLDDVVQTWTQISNGQFAVTDHLFDLFGNEQESSHPYSRASFAWAGLAGTSALRLAFFDDMGMAREVHADQAAGIGPSLVFLDTPWVEVRQDEAGYRTRLTHDAHQRVRMVQTGQGRDALPVRGYYDYDPEHRLVRYQDARLNEYLYSYDGAGRLRSSSGPDIGAYTFDYEGLNRIRQQDSAGGRATWQYDAIGRPVALSVTDPLDAIDGLADYTWSWDTAWKGALDGTTDPVGSTSWAYDAFGREKTVTRRFAGLSSAVPFSYKYDLRNRVTKKTWPSGQAISSTYRYGWLTSQSDPSGARVSFSYDLHGQLQSWNSSLGHLVRWTRSTPLRPDGVEMSYGVTSSRVRLYSWLENGLLDSVYNGTDTRYFDYDDDRRLTQASRGSSRASAALQEQFAYDEVGNLTAMIEPSGVSWNYDRVGTAAFPGNRLPGRQSATGREIYTYDGAGRLTSSTSGSTVREYVYDGLGRLRAVKSGGTVTLHFDRDAAGEIVKRTTGSGIRYTFREWDKNLATGVTTETQGDWGATENGTRRWFYKPHDGEVAAVLADNGTTLGARELSAYGLDVATTGTPWNLEAFHGTELENGMNLFAMGPRHLMRRDGQWLQPEPLLHLGIPPDMLADPTRLSPYRYARNTPTTFSDPTGYAPGEKQPDRPAHSTQPATAEQQEPAEDSASQRDTASEEQEPSEDPVSQQEAAVKTAAQPVMADPGKVAGGLYIMAGGAGVVVIGAAVAIIGSVPEPATPALVPAGLGMMGAGTLAFFTGGGWVLDGMF